MTKRDYSLKGKRVWVAGHRGMAGSAIVRRLASEGCTLLTATRQEADLRRQDEVERWMATHRPQVVFMAAATVGGILANSTRPAEFIYDNLAIETNVIHAAWKTGVEKLLFLGSSCIYPRLAPQPMKEEHLLTGALEPTNEAYAVAKIAGIKMCAAYNRQYGTNFQAVMPTNLYGPGDNYDLASSHVLPALIRKAHEAKVRGERSMTVWGSGTPRREFLHSDDLADACVFLVRNYDARDTGEFVNVGVGQDLPIRALAETVARVVGFAGELAFDVSKPDGTPRKLLDVSRLTELGWRAKVELEAGIASAYADFLERFAESPAPRTEGARQSIR